MVALAVLSYNLQGFHEIKPISLFFSFVFFFTLFMVSFFAMKCIYNQYRVGLIDDGIDTQDHQLLLWELSGLPPLTLQFSCWHFPFIIFLLNLLS